MTIYQTKINQLITHLQQITLLVQQVLIQENEENSIIQNQIKEDLKEQEVFTNNFNTRSENTLIISQFIAYQLFLKLWMANLLSQKEILKFDFSVQPPMLFKQFEQGYKEGYTVFQPSIFDDYLPHHKDFEIVIRELILIIESLKLNQQDVIGIIYNTFLQNEEQQESGQHFTNINEVDIINVFCIKKDTQTVLDSGCGAGNFLVRVYAYLKYLHPSWTNEKVIQSLWGIEIERYTAFLCRLNIQSLNPNQQDLSPQIITQDFVQIKPNEPIPTMDTCIGNPPYIRQELIPNKIDWIQIVRQAYPNLPKLDLKSDLYVYYMIHTASFLKEGGRFGYVIATSWMDNNFGAALQQFLLQHFKIITIIEQQLERSFNTATVNTCILILEKCATKQERNTNLVKFIRLFKPYTHFIGAENEENRFERIEQLTNQIENCKSNTQDANWQVVVKTQEQIRTENSIKGRYQNGKWGAKYLRSPLIYHKVMTLTQQVNSPLIQLESIAMVKYGIKTGANDFFYLINKSHQAKGLDIAILK